MPSAVRAACDMAFAIAKATPGVSIRRSTGTFRDETLRMPIFGCGLALSGSFKRAEATGDAAIRLRDAFMAQGWTEARCHASFEAHGMAAPPMTPTSLPKIGTRLRRSARVQYSQRPDKSAIVTS